MTPRRPADDLATAVASGDHRKALEALRDRLAAEIGSGKTEQKGSEVAALAKQLADVLKQLAAMPAAKEASAVDDLAKRRAARRKKATAPKPAAKRVKRGAGGGRASS